MGLKTTKKEFVRVIELFKALRGRDDAMQKSLSLYGNCRFNLNGEWEQAYLSVLEMLMEDQKSQWISYWIYDLEFGTKADEFTVTAKDGKGIPIKTITDLYKMLTA